MLAAVAGPAEPGDLAGQDAAHAAFTRLASRPGTSHAALRSARRSLSGRPARGRLPLAAALAVAAAGLGSTAAAYADVLPSPIQHFAHVAFGAPPPRNVILRAPAAARSPAHNHPGPSTPAPVRRQSAASSDPVSDKTHPGQFHGHLRKGNGAGPGYPSCVPGQATEQDHGRAVGHDKDPAQPSPAPNQLKSGSTQGLLGSGHGQDTASPPGWLALPTAACPGGTGPAKAAHAAGQ